MSESEKVSMVNRAPGSHNINVGGREVLERGERAPETGGVT